MNKYESIKQMSLDDMVTHLARFVHDCYRCDFFPNTCNECITKYLKWDGFKTDKKEPF